jgi:putative adenylate-forming enzyme
MQPMTEHVEELNDYRPDILVAPAQVLVYLSKRKLNHDLQTQVEPKLIISVAEVLEPEDKHFVEHCFSVRVHQIYQCTEGFIGHTCREGHLHLNEDILLIEKEYLHDQKSPQNPHEHLKRFVPVVTDLRRSTQPIVKYRLDDVLVENTEPCDCGSVFTRLENIEGRCDDVLWLADRSGNKLPIYPGVIRNTLITASDQLDDYQVIQTAPMRLTIKLRPMTDQHAHLVRVYLEKLFEKFDVPTPALDFRPLADDLFNVKKRRVIGLKS